MNYLIKKKSCFLTWLFHRVLVTLVLIAPSLEAKELFDAKSYLQHIITARENLTFTGTFNYSRSPDYRVEWHVYQKITSDGKTKEWVKLNDKDEGFILIDKQVACVTNGYKSKFRTKTILQSLDKEDIDNLLKDYDISLSDKDLQIANRVAHELTFEAKDKYRYTYKMAFDKLTFFPLQYVFLDKDNNILEQGQFTQFNPVPNDQVRVKPFANRCLKTNKQQAKINPTDWTVAWRPKGFDLERVITSQHNDEQLVYSDGLVYFSVFIEPLSDPRMANLERYFGATAVVSRRVSLPNDKDYFVTVVGEIPVATAERIALSLQKQNNNTQNH